MLLWWMACVIVKLKEHKEKCILDGREKVQGKNCSGMFQIFYYREVCFSCGRSLSN